MDGKRRNLRQIVMTAYKQGEESIVRIDRLRETHVDHDNAHYVAEGPFKGIIINPPSSAKFDEVEEAHTKLVFNAYLGGKSGERERRELRFWFKPQVEEATRSELARKYLKALLQPEAFPRDYTSFYKKAILLCQRFVLLLRLDIVIRPASVEQVDQRDNEVELTASSPVEPEYTAHRLEYLAHVPDTGKQRKYQDEESEEEEESEDVIENFITVLTPAVYDYQYLPEVPVSDKTHVVFRLKAKADAHVALSSVYGDTDRKTYEIVIGGWDNTHSAIRLGGMGEIVTKEYTPSIINGDDSRNFWISWDKNMIQLGENCHKGHDILMRWKIPQDKLHSINCIAVSTGPGSEGEWEFVEKILPPKEGGETNVERRARIRLSLLWLAKKQRMIQLLEEIYPNSIETSELMRECNIKTRDMMYAVVFLKELHRKGLIKEVHRGIWLRSPGAVTDTQHKVNLVDEIPTETVPPTIAIITAMYCEKQAVDAMMEDKVSFVKFKMESARTSILFGESQIYTIGRMGNHHVVSTKLCRLGSAKGDAISAGNAVTRLLGTFKHVEHVIIVGCGGGVPNYQDYNQHVRLGDVVVSVPDLKNGPLYVHCEKVDRRQNGVRFTTQQWSSESNFLLNAVQNQRKIAQRSYRSSSQPWDRFIQQGKEILKSEESSYHRPASKTDKLNALINGEVVHVEHPKPPPGIDQLTAENEVRVRYGPIGSSRPIARHGGLRMDFWQETGVLAFDAEFGIVLDSILGNQKQSFLLIRGIADYEDGQKNKDWQPFASLAAAAYCKSLITTLPSSNYRR